MSLLRVEGQRLAVGMRQTSRVGRENARLVTWLSRFPVFVGLGLALLLAAWLMATPPFDAPDEQSHYLRALTITNGNLLGPKASNFRLPGLRTPEPDWQRAQQAWVDHDARGVHVLAKLSPPDVGCADGAPDVGPRGCVEITVTGDYPPLAYLLPAVALRSATSPSEGDWVARAASAIPVLAFLLMAVAAVATIGPWAILGLLVAVTPMVLFVGSVLNSSGLDIAASLACAAAAIRIADMGTRAPRWVWIVLALSGAVAILSWQLGPWFVLLSLVLSATLAGWGLGDTFRVRRRRTISTGLALLAAYAVSMIYGLSSGVFHGSVALTPVGGRIRAGIAQLVHWVLPDSVGDFGWQTVHLPTAAYWVWWLGALTLLASAVWLGRRRERVVLTASILIAVAFPVLFYAFIYSQAGFGLQGREVLPVLTLVPLLAGTVVQRAIGDPGAQSRRVIACAVAALGCFQLFAWWINARHSAGAPGAVWFLARSLWSPPAGWWPWTVLAVVGAACLATAAVPVSRRARFG